MGKKEKKKLHMENPMSDHGVEEAEYIKANITESDKVEETEKMTVKIEVLSPDPDKIHPIVGYFPSGYDPMKKSSEETDPENIEQQESRFSLFRNRKRTTRFQLVVGGSHVNFVGTNYSGEATAAELCHYSIGVLDKETQTLKIIPIAGNKIIRLDPKIGPDTLEDEDNLDKQEMTAEEKAAKTNALTAAYSTKRAIRRSLKREALIQHANAGADHEIEGNELTNQNALENIGTIGEDRNIPPYNMAATTPETAYPLDKIISKGEWACLSDIIDLSEAGEPFRIDCFPSFVCNRVHTLADIKDHTKKEELAGIFSYITHLVKYKDKHSLEGFSSAKSHKIPGMLFQKFSSMFGVSESKRLPAEKVDLLISYVLVLTLYVDNFRTDPFDIAKDLRMSKAQLRPRFELLGCKYIRDNKVPVVTLPVPLKFATMQKKRKKARG
ncbi:unnamed protein product [Cuscuta epithymum]|uniref:DNA-directed RNA polymerase I subunit rpa49 n=1 Tax=Cuscuta epithymum TaxID=186058 RepID=A0AAV0F3R0_9ASTE|nr:unnamed protein product [Cuscuta epithymum]